MYKPLPEGLIIKKSAIHGLGLFTEIRMLAGTNLGIGWIRDERFSNGQIRTPLGGFINHAYFPNCEQKINDDLTYLITLRIIEPEEELTLNYFHYGSNSYNKDQLF